MTQVIEILAPEVIVVGETEIELIEVAAQGPAGPAGANGAPGTGGVQTITLTAARDLSGHRIVVATATGADYADPATPAHADAMIGLTTGAALSGDDVTVLAAGELVEPSWSWTPGLPLYAAPSGLLSHTPPASGWVQIVATAITPTRLLLSSRQAILSP
ncbi:MAG: hypothetical protein Q8O33_04495 [Pseudomonadota bacterium]|nr:hypothetical protein [Pseudomonadota bacterium]